ncbi:MAG TPA: TetR/AcrR family transcriptional regulator [Spirillospora sp.]|nr:TetR/AcrR family transcriptional regulator [Spirillospora sp.]
MSSSYETFGRINQKIRTRAAIKAAAAELIQRGEMPSMEQIAEAALVSKSTAYRYFPSQEALIAEIMLDNAVKSDLENVYEASKTSGTAAERLEAVIRADHALVVKHEHAFRKAIGVMLTSHMDDSSRLPRRPGNRLRYLAEALAPLKDQLGEAVLQRLVMALALCVGIESIVVLRDICDLTPDEAKAVKLWMADALLQRALQDAAADHPDT